MPRETFKPDDLVDVPIGIQGPAYVRQQLRHRYAVEGVTIRAQLLRALKSAGYEIREEDIGDDRRKA